MVGGGREEAGQGLLPLIQTIIYNVCIYIYIVVQYEVFPTLIEFLDPT